MSLKVPGLPPPWKFGSKKVYLPNFLVILLRTPKLDPYQAKFLVPLNLSKFDLRDYLWHLYHVRALRVRSFVQQQPVQHTKTISGDASVRRWHRPQAKKFMAVELDRPFRWPDPPEDMSEWDKLKHEASDREAEDLNRSEEALAREPPRKRHVLAEQARALLDGKEKWSPTWTQTPATRLPRTLPRPSGGPP